MSFKGLALVASAFVFAACGGKEAAPAADTAATPAAPATAAPATGTTHEVKMVLNAQSQYVFVPATLTIKQGDAIKFVAESGFPHNVQLDPNNKASAAVRAQLDANFSEKASTLLSNIFATPGQSVTVSFANVAPGTYEFSCPLHIAMNMTGSVTVQ